MWRRTYLILLVIRIYFALSPSYLHPDENFQGPEIFAEQVYSYPAHLTWEFTSSKPIRSIFPLWLSYGLPMTVLKWFWTETGSGSTPPYLIYYVLRGTMFGLSFVLEDWAIHELITSPRHRREAVVLVASSYVTWTYQTHTFSNSLETLLVAWSLVVIQRILENRVGFTSMRAQNSPWVVTTPFAFVSLALSGIIFSLVAIYADTSFYSSSPVSISDIFRKPIITPLNNLLYNSDKTNLASHGLHPHYQHFLINAPQLLGPVYVLLIASIFSRSSRSNFSLLNMRALSALTGTLILSVFPHQESRFLIPCVPLLLTCFRLPNPRVFLVTWIAFNSIMGLLLGVYHQGGIIPAQLQIPTIISNLNPGLEKGPASQETANVFWWKTYSPPLWLLGDAANITIKTHDLMGIPGRDMLEKLRKTIPRCSDGSILRYPRFSGSKSNNDRRVVNPTLLVAPNSATFLDQYVRSENKDESQDDRLSLQLDPLWRYDCHLHLDDMDFGDDGILPTLKRVVGRRGLNVWLVTRACG
ncbi:GPI mannosyltransferase, putative [Coccidioides posadasii C735 delta SOWgp]|uniref:Mannosyltransferase n=2 Tax=Coccidioides posadasii TaxID=199306 RepID=A0A0J6F2V7_COCPO|nr:GPI mannosyltransferase, putative [Coccidioides posadasii C735 delta SOWgp]EER27410.1 GPI mannosyltransferase, putative [Coccidioides posadasii C735 delta SOWgp]KMM67226.1 GPI mannosyltransferase 4 [Coccidioides posadasii RMSCC 3488]|eukprot:XP_003069555.1 GPI mannosyltransferase, putative [Coccidioides posadasii C735 delta SOWgp]